MPRGHGANQRRILERIDFLATHIWNGHGRVFNYDAGFDNGEQLWPDGFYVHSRRWLTLEMAGLVDSTTTRSQRNGLTRAVRSLADEGILELKDTFPYQLFGFDETDESDRTFAELDPFDRTRGGRQLWFRPYEPSFTALHLQPLRVPYSRGQSPVYQRVMPDHLAALSSTEWDIYPRNDIGLFDADDVWDDPPDFLWDYVHARDRTLNVRFLVPFLGWYLYGWYLPGIEPPRVSWGEYSRERWPGDVFHSGLPLGPQ